MRNGYCYLLSSRRKDVTTAEGGAICLNLPEPFDNAELYKELRMMSLNCQTKDAFPNPKPVVGVMT